MFHLDSTKFSAADVDKSGGAVATIDPISLWLGRVWRAKFWMLAFAVLAVGGAFAFTAVVKPSFESSAMLYIDPQDLQILPNDVNARAPTGDSGAMFVESQARIIQSAEVFRDVVMKLGLQTDPEFAGKVRSADGTGQTELLSAIDSLSGAVRIVHADRTYVVEIYARSENPEKAARIANAVVASYMSIREAQRTKVAADSAAAIEARLAELRRELSAAEHAADQFKVENGIVAANGQSLVEARVNDANTALSAAQTAMTEAKTRFDQLSSAKGDPLLLMSSPESLSSPDLQRLRASYEQANATLQAESATHGPKHPTVVRASAELASVSKQISLTAERLRTSAKLQYDSSVAAYDEANAELAKLTAELQSSDSALVQLRLLDQEVTSSRAVYEDALLRARQTREQEQINTANVQVISQATAPLQKRFPPKLTVLIPLAVAIGLGIGAVIGIALQLFPITLWRKPAKIEAAKVVKAAPVRPQPSGRPVQASGLRRLAALKDREPSGNAA